MVQKRGVPPQSSDSTVTDAGGSVTLTLPPTLFAAIGFGTTDAGF